MILASLAIAAGFASCNTSSSLDIAGEWAVVSLNGNEVPQTMKEPVLNIDTNANTFNGITGVNNISGDFTMKNGEVKFSDGPMTKMMGDPVSNEVEVNYIKAIMSAKTVAMENDQLVIKDGKGNTVMTLKKK